MTCMEVIPKVPRDAVIDVTQLIPSNPTIIINLTLHCTTNNFVRVFVSY